MPSSGPVSTHRKLVVSAFAALLSYCACSSYYFVAHAHQSSFLAGFSLSSSLDLSSLGIGPPHFSEAPNDPESFSSCLMVMDDNHRLVEWLAYHYFVMNLRYLVILPDPKSRFSPNPILDRWRKYMKIVIWTDEDCMNEEQYQDSVAFRKRKSPSEELAQTFHDDRQDLFLRQCAIHMKINKRKWVGFHDVDEYYVVSSDLVDGAAERMREQGGGIKLLNQITSTMDALKENTYIDTLTTNYLGPCVSTYRTLYGAVDSTQAEISKDVPSIIDPRRFETLRWRQHLPHKHPQDGKVLLDVSRVDMKMLASEDSFYRSHKLLSICPSIYFNPDAFFRLNHYVGNWEYYSFRQNDERAGARRNRDQWEKESIKMGGTSGDDIRPWIAGFFLSFGEDEASRLLRDCGLDPDYEAGIKKTWLHERDRKLLKKIKLKRTGDLSKSTES